MDNFSAVERAKQARRKRPALNQRNYSDPALRFGWVITWAACGVAVIPLGALVVYAVGGIYSILLIACVILGANRGKISEALRLLVLGPILIILASGVGVLITLALTEDGRAAIRRAPSVIFKRAAWK